MTLEEPLAFARESRGYDTAREPSAFARVSNWYDTHRTFSLCSVRVFSVCKKVTVDFLDVKVCAICKWIELNLLLIWTSCCGYTWQTFVTDLIALAGTSMPINMGS
jgi:hypothetical protein